MATAVLSPTEISAKHRIPTLDGWRGIAILLVLVSHLQWGLFHHEIISTGIHGVAVFFVLSGYLITSKLREEYQQTGSINLKHFFIRRLFRLMPAAWTYLLAIGLMTRHGLVLGRHTILACLLFYRNFNQLIDAGPGSFITGHFWSLSIEEQFYLFWPSTLLLLGFRRVRYFCLVVAVIVAAVRLHHWSMLMTIEPAESFATQYRADALFVGCAAALSVPLLSRYVRGWMLAPLCALLILCISKYSLLIPLWEPVVIALAIFSTSTGSHPVMARTLEWKPLVYLGTISYSLYLWQEPFLWTHIDGATSAVVRLAVVAGTAVLSYHFIERPMIAFGRRLIP
jgi:peptidoglycan/LPS O-acetylase OafA/YrhL